MVNDNSSQSRRRNFLKIGGAVATGMVGLAGCVGDSGSDDTGGSNSNGGKTTERKSLIEKAKEEGAVKIASPLSGPAVGPFNTRFEEEYGITVTYREASSKPTANKVLQEYQAGKQSFDLVSMPNVAYHITLAEQGVYRTRPEALADLGTTWYKNNTIPVQMYQMDLGWLYNNDVVDTPPKTWSELVSGDYRVTLDTEEPELIVVFEAMFGLEEAKKMVRAVGEVASFHKSHTAAAKTVAQGVNDLGILKYYHVYAPWGMDVLSPLHHERAMTHKGKTIPAIAVPNYMPLCKDSPHPNAGALYLKFAVNNFADMINEAAKERVGGDLQYAPQAIPFSYPEKHEGIFPLTYEYSEELTKYFDLYQKLVGLR